MRCPKCGAFMQEGKDTCMMCGTNIKTYVPENNPNAEFSSKNSSAFGSGNDFQTGASNYNRPPYSSPSNNYQPSNNPKPTHYAPLNSKDKDIFDRYQENKGLVSTILIIVLFAIVGFAGFMYFKSRNKEEVLKPVIQNLYFVVDESFSDLGGHNSNTVSYAKSGDKGNDCTITVSVGSSTSGNHVEEFFDEMKESLEPEKDASNNVINELDIYTPSEGSIVVNDTTWYYLNVFYKNTADGHANQLRYKYMTSMYKGQFYDITLINYSNDAVCSASLDNFSKSLKFLE